MANLVPLGEKVIVKPLLKESTTASGIVLTTGGEEKAQEGEVIAVGPGRLLDDGGRGEMGLQVGDKVLFNKYAIDEFDIDGEKVLVINESSILAKFE